MKPINLADKLSQFKEHYKPHVVGEFNGHEIMVAKLQGPFVWHKHDDTDDLFLVLQGKLTVRLRDGDVHLEAGELLVVPRGVEHCPIADEEAHVLLMETAGTPNTGDVESAVEKKRI